MHQCLIVKQKKIVTTKENSLILLTPEMNQCCTIFSICHPTVNYTMSFKQLKVNQLAHTNDCNNRNRFCRTIYQHGFIFIHFCQDQCNTFIFSISLFTLNYLPTHLFSFFKKVFANKTIYKRHQPQPDNNYPVTDQAIDLAFFNH
jgi:hypothetical protein